MVNALADLGWTRLPADQALQPWVEAARQAGEAALRDPVLAHWHTCRGTWFVGVDALDNDCEGSVRGVALSPVLTDWVRRAFGPLPPLHRAQISVTFPGYPQPRAGEGPAAFAYRRDRDAAHVDGLLGEGSPKRRRIAEPHAWILGLPLTDADAGAAPLVVWEGSHRIIRAALAEALAGHAPDDWAQVDVTDAYVAARRRVFRDCTRRTLPARPGEAIVLHRHLLHGVAPWQPGASSNAPGRMIAYFRPLMAGGVPAWIEQDAGGAAG